MKIRWESKRTPNLIVTSSQYNLFFLIMSLTPFNRNGLCLAKLDPDGPKLNLFDQFDPYRPKLVQTDPFCSFRVQTGQTESVLVIESPN